jgi:hypothetical protein
VLAAVDAGLLLEVVWASLLAGVVVSVLFSLVVLFGARSLESGRSGAGGAAMAYGVAALLAMATFALIVGYGVQVMLSKD